MNGFHVRSHGYQVDTSVVVYTCTRQVWPTQYLLDLVGIALWGRQSHAALRHASRVRRTGCFKETKVYKILAIEITIAKLALRAATRARGGNVPTPSLLTLHGFDLLLPA